MICNDCKNKHHDNCKSRNAGKQPADCDCQHRVETKGHPNVAPKPEAGNSGAAAQGSRGGSE